METGKAAARNPLLGAAVLKATLAERPGGLMAQQPILDDVLLALGITEAAVDAYAVSNPELVAQAVAKARGPARHTT